MRRLKVYNGDKTVNLVLSGGGIKGIAYAGAFNTAEMEGIRWGNIAGVSAGALVGAYVSAGYDAGELRQILNNFDFSKVDIANLQKKVPAIAHYMAFKASYRGQIRDDERILDVFLNSPLLSSIREGSDQVNEFFGYRGSLLKNIITLCKEGCLCDGDFLEEWVHKTLARKGIRTFGDLRGGMPDSKNPSGYKVRMTAVDANRAKVIVLPDDIRYYGIDPDKLEVSRAVRMSTCVPFAFKPVVIKKQEGLKSKTYNIVDGGVLDNFPAWLMDYPDTSGIFGFRLGGSEKKKFFSLDTPFNVMKAMITSVHDIGVDKNIPKIKYMEEIDTGEVSFLDFNLNEQDKQFLYSSGEKAAGRLISRYKADTKSVNRAILDLIAGKWRRA